MEEEIIGYMDLLFTGGSIRAYTGFLAASEEKEDGWFLDQFEGLLQAGALTGAGIKKYGGDGEIFPAQRYRAGKVIDLTLRFIGETKAGTLSAWNSIVSMQQSNRVTIDTDTEGIGPYECIEQEDTISTSWETPYMFTFGVIFKAKEAF